MARLYPVLLLLCLALSLVAGECGAADSYWRSVGLRGGFSEPAPTDNLYQGELFAVYQFPWELRGGSGWGVATRLDLSTGVLSGAGDVGFIGSFGPLFAIGKPDFPLELNVGVGAAVLGRDHFGTRNYNGLVQFISHVGIEYRLTRHTGVGYRFQHISNAGLNGHHNPGSNLHLFGVQWYFDHGAR